MFIIMFTENLFVFSSICSKIKSDNINYVSIAYVIYTILNHNNNNNNNNVYLIKSPY